MLRFFAILCLASVGLCQFGGQFGGQDEALKKYVLMKVLSGCIGEDFVQGIREDMMQASMVCQAKFMNMTDKPNFDEMVEEMEKAAAIEDDINEAAVLENDGENGENDGPVYVPYPVPVYIPLQAGQNPLSSFPQFLQGFPKGFPQGFPFPSQSEESNEIISRRRRSIPFGDDLEEMKDTITAKIKNTTCVFTEMNLITEDKMLNYELIENMTMSLNVSDVLKEDLLYAHDICKDFSSCLPVEKAKHPMIKELGALFAYMKCTSKNAIRVCMKNDVRKAAEELGSKMKMDLGLGIDMKMLMPNNSTDPAETIDNLVNFILDSSSLF